MANARAPKQWSLTKNESVNSFENWRQNLIYTLSLDPSFTKFLSPDKKWAKKTKAAPNRDFTDDDDQIANARTKEQKSAALDLMLGQIANFCPVIARNTIVRNSTSLEQIWQTIRLHYGFQLSGAHFLDFNDIKLRSDEKPEDLYQRLIAFIDDNLLKKDGGISHNGEPIIDDEELTPSLENITVLTWLRLIHCDLPRLVKQRYGTELRSRTLASIKPEISQALPSLLEEIRTAEDAKVMRSNIPPRPLPTNKYSYQPRQNKSSASKRRTCPICKAAGRSDTHFLSECRFLPDEDRKYMAKARQIIGIIDNASSDESENDDNPHQDQPVMEQSMSSYRVSIRQSPYLDLFVGHIPVRLTIDSGATGNMIRESTARYLDATVKNTSQSAHQADGSSPLKVIGETRLTFTRDDFTFYFDGLVVANLDVEVLAGIPFMEKNDICIRPSKREVRIGDSYSCHYGSEESTSNRTSVRRAQVLRSSSTETIWPGEFMELKLPTSFSTDDTYAIEPHASTPGRTSWVSPDITRSVAGKIRVPNLTGEPQNVHKHDHLCQIRSVFTPDTAAETKIDADSSIGGISTPPSRDACYSASVSLDPNDILSDDMKSDFRRLHNKFDSVFSTSLEGYNGNAGPFKGKVNMGPVLPPQRKGRIPQYSRNQLEELQRKFNELEEHGIFRKPEDVDVTVEYLNPSFLVKKGNGTYRLVTAFTEVGRYSKPQPSLMPDVDSTLRKIGQWKFIVVTDLTKSFYQIPLSHDSMKYCGVVTPFKGIRVYTRCAMGMPGSETALEELTCRVLGDLLEEGIVTKLADDLYCGGNTPQELLENWTKVLEALQKCNLKLSATKTVIAPRTTTILGWIWEQGTLKANPHRIAALSSCEPPKTVKALRSFSGAVKVLARVLPGCSSMLAPLDDAIAGRDSKDNILWDDTLISSFTQVQQSLNSSKTIHIPRTDDTLWIVTDAAVRSPGIGATLYITRGDKILLSGFFSAKLRKHQISWIPCEVEALAIAVAVKHFSPYIVQSSKPTCILTDSRPCVMAYEKLGRGEFSASPRVYTFLSTVSRYQVSVRHVAGSAILPSDFSSRSTPDCIDPTCQVCQFINTTVDSVVRNITVSDILTGKARLPFTSRAAWMSIQAESSDLRRTRAHLLQGTRPSRKITNLPDVKRYLRVATVAYDGLVIVKRSEPFQSSRELIVIPREVLHGILTSLHIQLQHPSRNQLKLVTQRFFYAIDMDKAIDLVTGSCHQCASIQKVPHMLVKEDTGDPPEAIGTSFACDIMKRERQLLLVVRECVTSYTSACIIENEQHDTIRDALIPLCINLRPLDGPPAIIRTDPGPGFIALVNDPLLKDCRLSLEIGRVKNKNKNPVAERAIQELRDEILRLDPTNRTVNTVSLCLALSAVNTRIRSNGLSAREMLTHRNQFTNAQIPVCDRDIILDKHQARLKNHPFSEVSKAPKEKRPDTPSIDIGDLVYLHRDRNKSRARDRYLVVASEAEWCSIRKFVGNQLRNCSYRVKKSECFRVPSDSNDLYLPTDVVDECSSDDNEEAPAPHAHSYLPPSPAPDIPIEISASGTSDINLPSSVESDDSKPQTMIEPNIDVSMPTEQHTSDRPRRNIRLPSRFNDFVM
ncbi:hypothetical protein FSP39_017698 [Pinctada imbricata]|uniref:Uncharacterized protein n=1 Tax=Pinctada imbricata TaxID=66713 RepID=A0AA89C898_PINIB|nr:hypothetical protein FSP39_017698 [Pinctada imbricata]